MKKIATATIATAGIATFAFAHHDAQAAEQNNDGAYGHVAYVEGVNSNGSIRVSEMNYGHGAGVVTSRTISASQAASYNYIH
ncbi:CHAP domain-containing protein [Staphylococcus epidermidis]|nr:CHAP domain-containing protein [Staphylococcus epidermidis]